MRDCEKRAPFSRARAVAAVLATIAAAAVTHTAAAQGVDAPGPAPSPTLQQRLEAVIGRPGGLTADQVAARARATSFEAKSRRAESAAAEAGVDQAVLGFVPRVAAKASYMRLSDIGTQSLGNLVAAPGTPVGGVPAGASLANVPVGFTFPNDNYALQADVTVPISDYVLRLTQQLASAKRSARAAELTARAAELGAATQARVVYYTWARAKVQQVVAEAALDLARQHLVDAKARLAAGQASNADVLQVEAQLADGELFVERAKNAAATAEDRLRTALHDGDGRAYAVGEPLLVDLPPLPGSNDAPSFVDEAMRRRVELRAARESTEALRAQASAARAAVLPRLDAVASALYANPNPRYFPPPAEWHGTWAVGAVLSWASNDAILGGTGASAASARADATDAQEVALREGIRAEVLGAYEAVTDAEAAIRSTQRSLAAAEEAYRVRRALFRVGQATSTELSGAETVLTRARFEAVNARIDLRIARAEMMHATGRDADRE